MYRVLLFFLILPAAVAQPALLINNAALPVSSQTNRIAPRSLVQVMLDPSFDGPLSGNAGQPPAFPDVSQPLTLTIQPHGSEELTAEILTASSFRVVAVLPTDLPLGPATMTLTYNGGATSSGMVEIVQASFALFAGNSGFGPALAQNVNSGASIELNGLTRPARPGGYVTLWGSGLGNTTQQEISVLLDGRPVPVHFAGPSPTLDGLDQINIFVPFDEEIANGCYVLLQVSVLGDFGRAATISKTDAPGPCAHPLGLSEQQMQRLDEGGSVPIGRIGIYSAIGPLNRIVTDPPDVSQPPDSETLTRFESASATLLAVDAGGVASFSRPPVQGGLWFDGDSDGACHPNRPRITAVAGFISSSGGVNLGDSVQLSGPQDRFLDLPSEIPSFGFYRGVVNSPPPVTNPADLPPAFFVAGGWEFLFPGGPGADAFLLPVSLPPPVELTNFEEVTTIERSAGATVTWNAEGYRESDTMLLQIQGRERGANDGSGSASDPLSLECRVPALAGEVAIGSKLLERFEPSTPQSPSHLMLQVSGPPEEESHFTVELTTGETVPGLINYGFSEYFPIELR